MVEVFLLSELFFFLVRELRLFLILRQWSFFPTEAVFSSVLRVAFFVFDREGITFSFFRGIVIFLRREDCFSSERFGCFFN